MPDDGVSVRPQHAKGLVQVALADHHHLGLMLYGGATHGLSDLSGGLVEEMTELAKLSREQRREAHARG